MSFGKIYEISGAALNAQSIRLNTIASNLANADSVAGSPDGVYKARRPVFQALYDNAGLLDVKRASSASVGVRSITESGAPIPGRYEPSHPLADAEGYVYSSNVNPIEESADMMSTSRNYEANVEIMNQAKSMQQALLKLGNQ